jgi:hypothetical protein
MKVIADARVINTYQFATYSAYREIIAPSGNRVAYDDYVSKKLNSYSSVFSLPLVIVCSSLKVVSPT